MIKINTVEILAPSEYSVSIQDISKAERNANGLMILERIATKRKIELAYSVMTSVQMSTLLSAITSTFFIVEYPDPQTGAARTGTFYVGDRSCSAISYSLGTAYWKSVKFSLIER